MLHQKRIDELTRTGRKIETARRGDEDLGPLQQLPGTWSNLPGLPGRGWNAIALPFAPCGGGPNYRLLVNQYNETLKFTLVDKAVPNRGIARDDGSTYNADQFVVTLDYEQMIAQIAADDFPRSGLAGDPGLAIHHEAGLFLHLLNRTTEGLDIARLASIPHGDSVLGLGSSEVLSGGPSVPVVDGLPLGGPTDLASPYLAPYAHFDADPFKGVVADPGFAGFNPIRPHELLVAANSEVHITRTIQLEFDTAIATGGISNVPFVVKQANAAAMKSVFWIQELDECDDHGEPRLRLQYLQVVLLDFFPRGDGFPGRIRWPHVSINTMERVAEPHTGHAELPPPRY